MIEKQGIINLSSYGSKCYASVLLCDSTVAILLKGVGLVENLVRYDFQSSGFEDELDRMP